MAFKRSAVRSRLSPPSGTGKARFDESQNELFLFPPCRLIYPMSAITHSPFIQAKALLPNIQKKARFYIALFSAQKEGSPLRLTMRRIFSKNIKQEAIQWQKATAKAPQFPSPSKSRWQNPRPTRRVRR